MNRSTILFLPLLFLVGCTLLPVGVRAQNLEIVSVSPVVIDQKAKARDILKQTITITNTSDRKLDIYPSVNDIHPEEGEQAFQSAFDADDRSASLANWIELSRGVIELGPGEKKDIPFVIRVNLNAIPNTYHADISFTEGGTREAADAAGAIATVTVNLEVQADIKEVMQLNKFFTDNVFFSGDDVLFNYQLENIGNQELQPKGEIRIYNRKGEEVASIDVNKDGKSISPEQIAQLASVWNAADGFGKFKAFLNVDYGKSQTASVQDTVFFWIVPWKQLLAVFVGSLIGIIGFALYFHRIFERRHMNQLAVAGMPTMAIVTPEIQRPAPVVAPEPKESKMRKWASALSFSAITQKFARKHAAVPEPVSPTTVASVVEAPVATHESAIQPRRSLRDALGDVAESRHHASGGTIDLKRMNGSSGGTSSPTSISSASAVQHGHVINLKKK